ncbi:Sec-independent protein translocase protein TatB [Stenotrophomonas sp. Iso1]|uniref:Sec-independent protein translocase protein TatB n=1 Tax=Stenotrophomonas sp. Iso1 TaxID=2977283 RepID=UPI0022B7D03E|nr:Sec-independent protein translocase protein TatB [Stenotrophomonas sp. Iso1]
MFDIGFSELLLIAVVALVVLGPERLPKAARFAGLWVRRARNQWDSVKQELERELHAEEIKRNLQDVRQSMQQTETELRDQARQVRDGADAIQQEAQQADLQPPGLQQHEVPAPAEAERVIEPRPIRPAPALESEMGNRAIALDTPAPPAADAAPSTPERTQ